MDSATPFQFHRGSVKDRTKTNDDGGCGTDASYISLSKNEKAIKDELLL